MPVQTGQADSLALGFGSFHVKLERRIGHLEEKGEVFPTSYWLREEA